MPVKKFESTKKKSNNPNLFQKKESNATSKPKEVAKKEPAKVEEPKAKKPIWIPIVACVFALTAVGVAGYAIANYFSTKGNDGIILKKDEVKFGSYPQVRVAESDGLQNALNKVVDGTPTKEYPHGWDSYKFYNKGEEDDYFWYKDFTYKGEKYRANFCSSYRSETILYETVSFIDFSSLNPYYTNNIYFFKYTPLVWRKLEKKANGYTYLMSSKIIDYREYEPRTAEIDLDLDGEKFKADATSFRLEAENGEFKDGENPSKGNLAIKNGNDTVSGGKYLANMDGNQNSYVRWFFDRDVASPKVYLTIGLSARSDKNRVLSEMFEIKVNDNAIAPEINTIEKTTGTDYESFVTVNVGFTSLRKGQNKIAVISTGDSTSIDYVDVYIPNKPVPNNYEHSYIRSFLNQDLLNTAFSKGNKKKMELMNVDNSSESTMDATNGYACNNTNDYVSLLSKKEFSTESYNLLDPTRRQLDITDYAKSLTYSKGKDCYWLRSPADTYLQAGVANYANKETDIIPTHYCYIGVVPTISVKL